MYEYTEESNPLNVQVLPHLEVQQDNLPVKHPYVPRICKEQGYFFIWKGDLVKDSDLIAGWINSSDEDQWVQSDNIVKGVALIYPYDDHTIVGSVKLAGYMRHRAKASNRQFLRTMWSDIVTMFGDKPIICPSGSFFENLHIKMNHKKIPHEAYHWKILHQNQFKRVGEYWIRT